VLPATAGGISRDESSIMLNGSLSIRRFSVALLALITVFGGCQSDDVQRTTVSGSVTLDGKPIPRGLIRFIATSGPVWSARIKDGQYTTEGTKGVPVGDLQVRIEAHRTPSWYKGGAATEGEETPLEQYLPKKYNLQSELRMTIEPGSTGVEKDFQLSSL
jgi:hypothetical protein